MATSNTPILYFGFGAMANPISRKRRDVHSRWECAAILKNFCLDFQHGGYATVTPKTGEEVHGVLMELSSQCWQNLVEFEKGYEVVQEEVYAYGSDDPSVANIFQFHPKNDELGERGIPQERYLKVIAMGLREHGVKEDYIVDKILSKQSMPSAKPEDYRRFPEAEVLPSITWDHYQTICAADAAFVVGDRIVQFGTRHLPELPFVQWMTKNILGKEDCTWRIWQTLLEPDLPQVESPEELSDLHVGWAEHHLLHIIEQSGVPVPSARHILSK